MRVIVPVVVVLVTIVGLAAIVYALRPGGERVNQPIAFNHAVHITDAGLECLDCHTDAGTAVRAGLPGKSMCLDCHDPDDEEIQEHPEKARLASYAEAEQNIPWVRVAVTKPDVFFSHRRHVTAAGLECIRCHPKQESLTAPPKFRREVMTMDDCLACHQEHNASTDCLACHR